MINSFRSFVTGGSLGGGGEMPGMDKVKEGTLESVSTDLSGGGVSKSGGFSMHTLLSMVCPRGMTSMKEPLTTTTPPTFESLQSPSGGGDVPDGLGPKHKPGGREEALEFTSKFPEGTVGYVVNRALGDVMPVLRFFGKEEFGSGSIGQHYREAEDMLSKPSTKENLRELAERETVHWNNEPDLVARRYGSYVGPNGRERMLQCTLRNIELSKKENEPKLPTFFD